MKTGYGTVTMESKMKEIQERKNAELENKIQELEATLVGADATNQANNSQEVKESKESTRSIIKKVLLLQVLPSVVTGVLTGCAGYLTVSLLAKYAPINTGLRTSAPLAIDCKPEKILDATPVIETTV